PIAIAANTATGQGTDTFANMESLVGGSGNDTIYGSAGDNILFGGAGNDTLVGGGGNNILNGGLGNDTMIGGAGNDTYVLDNAGDTFTPETPGGGIDTVVVPWSYNVAGTNIENVILTGTANLNATGDAGNNVLGGNAGDNVFIGGAGNDTINGDANSTLMSFMHPVTPTAGGAAAILASLVHGGDTIDYSGVTADLVVNIGPAGDIAGNFATGEGTDSLTNIENVTGGAGNDTIYDTDGSNILLGGAGNDTIYSFNGNDFVDAGAGSDTIQHKGGDLPANAGDTLLYGGDDHDYDTINAGAGNDTIILGDGGGFVFGAAGNDIIYGGSGGVVDDTDLTHSTGPGKDFLEGGDGNDTIFAGSADYTTIQGDTGDDNIFGGTGKANYLNGNDGNDTIHVVDGGSSFAYGGKGDDTILIGETASFGTSGVNTVDGGEGNDTIVTGGVGHSYLTGGGGTDTFVFDATALGRVDIRDTITDYKNTDGDHLDVSNLLNSLLGHQASEQEALDNVKATASGANTIVSVNNGGSWQDIATLTNAAPLVKILYDDQHHETTATHS
ncbi:beta strand repeat-containing protein, partial [Rhizobium sp. RAF56]|uniref:beta strand repeat-containing protein n=1 Tax=Rhizobium sp. RAF56 TaxID=3233062 RepID=UPI003F9ABB6F